ncbi:hypothetical protein [Ferruginibacter sp.]|nr:hypothetical protein [Ferruginibacter sp.]
MRYTLLIVTLAIFFTACKKDKFTTVPQISFESVKPNSAYSNIPLNQQYIPSLTISVTDAEGDLGFISGKDTSKIYVKNLLTGKEDSLILPNISTAAVKDFKGEISVDLSTLLGASTRPRPKVDTLFFEVYIKDFAKNKSNVIVSGDPVFYITP